MGSMKILLIEPNYSLGWTYQQALNKAGHKVNWQRTASAAIAAADTDCPDAVILELQLAGHSGIEFLYEFRSYTDWQNIPVILHTMVGEEQFALQRHQFDSLGITSFLYKPATSLRQLTRAISEVPVTT